MAASRLSRSLALSVPGPAGGAQGTPGVRWGARKRCICRGRSEGAASSRTESDPVPTSFPDLIAMISPCFVSVSQANASVFSHYLSGQWQRESWTPPGNAVRWFQESGNTQPLTPRRLRVQHTRAPHAGVPDPWPGLTGGAG